MARRDADDKRNSSSTCSYCLQDVIFLPDGNGNYIVENLDGTPHSHGETDFR